MSVDEPSETSAEAESFDNRPSVLLKVRCPACLKQELRDLSQMNMMDITRLISCALQLMLEYCEKKASTHALGEMEWGTETYDSFLEAAEEDDDTTW